LDQPWVYIVLFGLVLIVFAKIMPKTDKSKGQGNATINEIEETMEYFTAELNEQNNALIRLLAETKRDYELQAAKLASRIETLEKQSNLSAQETAKLAVAVEELRKHASKPVEIQAAAPDITIKKAEAAVEDRQEPVPASPMNMKMRYSDLFAMYDQGKSIDYIAKKLSMNKGEVNLIMQLAKQEERLNAH